MVTEDWEIVEQPKRQRAGPGLWADTIQRLISAGHDLENIRCYTLAQLRQFDRAIARQDQARLLERARAARAAMLDEDGFKSFVSRTKPMH